MTVLIDLFIFAFKLEVFIETEGNTLLFSFFIQLLQANCQASEIKLGFFPSCDFARNFNDKIELGSYSNA